MANYRWRESPDIIARLVNADKIQTLSSQQVMLKPNEACALIVDGRIGDILTETLLKSMAGGFSRWLGDKMGVTATDRRLLFAMTGPMDYWIPFDGQIANGEKVSGFANLRLRMELDDVPKLLNYFANNAPILNREGLIKILSDEVKARVVTPSLAMCEDYSELRSGQFLERFEMSAEMGMRNLLSNLGFTMVKAFPVTNPTDMELVQKHRAAIEAQTAGNQVNTEAQLAHYSQTEALTLARIEMETNVARAEAQGKVTIELESELKELRAQEAKWNAQLTFEREKMEIRSDEADAKTKRAMDMFEQVQARKADRIAKQQDFQNQRMESQNQFQKDMLELAAQHGALSPEVIQELLKQQTAQKAIDGSGEETNSDQ
tara:strand:- start:6671 stop:7798 length:1128 start_codon:yes stop_codon:yes gene_type:complete